MLWSVGGRHDQTVSRSPGEAGGHDQQKQPQAEPERGAWEQAGYDQQRDTANADGANNSALARRFCFQNPRICRALELSATLLLLWGWWVTSGWTVADMLPGWLFPIPVIGCCIHIAGALVLLAYAWFYGSNPLGLREPRRFNRNVDGRTIFAAAVCVGSFAAVTINVAVIVGVSDLRLGPPDWISTGVEPSATRVFERIENKTNEWSVQNPLIWPGDIESSNRDAESSTLATLDALPVSDGESSGANSSLAQHARLRAESWKWLQRFEALGRELKSDLTYSLTPSPDDMLPGVLGWIFGLKGRHLDYIVDHRAIGALSRSDCSGIASFLVVLFVYVPAVFFGRMLGYSGKNLELTGNSLRLYEILSAIRSPIGHFLNLVFVFWAHIRIPHIVLYIYRGSKACHHLQWIHARHYRGMQKFATGYHLTPLPVEQRSGFSCKLPVLQLSSVYHTDPDADPWTQMFCLLTVVTSLGGLLLLWIQLGHRLWLMYEKETFHHRRLKQDATKLDRKQFENKVNCSLNVLDLSGTPAANGFYFRTLFECSLASLIDNTALLHKLNEASKLTIEDKPYLYCMEPRTWHRRVNQMIQNKLSERFSSGFVSHDIGTPAIEQEFIFALTFERGPWTQQNGSVEKFRVMLAKRELLEGIVEYEKKLDRSASSAPTNMPKVDSGSLQDQGGEKLCKTTTWVGPARIAPTHSGETTTRTDHLPAFREAFNRERWAAIVELARLWKEGSPMTERVCLAVPQTDVTTVRPSVEDIRNHIEDATFHRGKHTRLYGDSREKFRDELLAQGVTIEEGTDKNDLINELVRIETSKKAPNLELPNGVAQRIAQIDANVQELQKAFERLSNSRASR